ncbi:MAG TPA: endolytic transglycosylase MltG, partial [Rectinemataceae bacterium]|nr:endolytic transglycosylase MltG [Rectinemataceae bacterium]
MPATRKPRALTALLLPAGLLVLAIVLGLAGMAFLLSASASIPAEGKLFTVERGESALSVAQRLEDEGLIRSALGFRLLGRIEAAGSGLKAGTYRIESGMGSPAILDLLRSGRQALVRLTLPEGFTLGQTARLLDRLGIAKAPDFQAAC